MKIWSVCHFGASVRASCLLCWVWGSINNTLFMLCGSEVMSEPVINCRGSILPIFETYHECDRSKSPTVGAIYIKASFRLINIYVMIMRRGYDRLRVWSYATELPTAPLHCLALLSFDIHWQRMDSFLCGEPVILIYFSGFLFFVSHKIYVQVRTGKDGRRT